MPFPAPGTSVPSLNEYGLSFNDLVIGPGSAYEIQMLEGFDRPDVRTGDQNWPRTRGQSRGLDLLAGRDMHLTMEIAASGGQTMAQLPQALRNALAPRGTTEDPLYVNIAGTTYVTYARVRKHNVPIDISYALGNLAKNVVVQLHATDPNFYDTPTKNPVMNLSPPSGGVGFPLGFPLSFGGSAGGNVITVTNNGDDTAYPIFYVQGPLTGPSITNVTTGQSLGFDLALNDGDLLIINTDTPNSATYYQSGSYPNNGVSRLYTITTASAWYGLSPGVGPNAVNSGVTTLSFNSQDTTLVTGTCNVWFADAYSSVT